MRHILLSMLTIFSIHSASADCEMSGISSLSDNITLHKKGMIVLEFYAASRSLIQDLNTKYPLYLKSNLGTTPLEVVEILKGEMELTQVVLKPAHDLSVGEVYVFRIDNLPSYEQQPGRFNRATQKWEPLTYKIVESSAIGALLVQNTPTVVKKTLVEYGCGPARWVYFKVSGQSKSELFARASVKNKTTGYITTCLLRIENGQVRVGHGMCSGTFHFSLGDSYEVTFQLVDQAGNKSVATSPVAFSKPTVQTKEE